MPVVAVVLADTGFGQASVGAAAVGGGGVGAGGGVGDVAVDPLQAVPMLIASIARTTKLALGGRPTDIGNALTTTAIYLTASASQRQFS